MAATNEKHGTTDGPHLLALSHSSLVISLMTSFLNRHKSFSSSQIPLSPSSALSTLSRIGSNPSITSKDPRDPLSYSLVSDQELKDGQGRLDEMLRGEKSCLLVLPMCHEMNDWDEPVTPAQRERKLRRWRYAIAPPSFDALSVLTLQYLFVDGRHGKRTRTSTLQIVDPSLNSHSRKASRGVSQSRSIK